MTYHHFVGDGLNRSEKIQQWVIDQLLNSKLPNEARESSIEWELKHSSGVIQMARLLAQKRGMEEELGEIAAAMHDIYVITHGSYENHAQKGAEIAKGILKNEGRFSQQEIGDIVDAIRCHSDKHIDSKNELIELIKDADCTDCFFYGDRVYDYKPPQMLKHYYMRIISIRKELGLPPKKYFSEQLSIIQKSGGIRGEIDE